MDQEVNNRKVNTCIAAIHVNLLIMLRSVIRKSDQFDEEFVKIQSSKINTQFKYIIYLMPIILLHLECPSIRTNIISFILFTELKI